MQVTKIVVLTVLITKYVVIVLVIILDLLTYVWCENYWIVNCPIFVFFFGLFSSFFDSFVFVFVFVFWSLIFALIVYVLIFNLIFFQFTNYCLCFVFCCQFAAFEREWMCELLEISMLYSTTKVNLVVRCIATNFWFFWDPSCNIQFDVSYIVINVQIWCTHVHVIIWSFGHIVPSINF